MQELAGQTISYLGIDDGSMDTSPRPSVFPSRYADLGEVGSGGQATVYRVLDRHLDAVFALKLLNFRYVEHPRARALFLAEAQATAQLQHPAIVFVQDQGELDDGRLWFTMSEVRGQTLGDAISQVHGADGGPGKWTLRRLVTAFQQMCEAVAYAHSEGIVHRDLKPDNLMVGAFGEVQIMDWGLAKATGQPHPVDVGAGVVVGTPAYMAPEQARGESDVTTAADNYALGCTLLHLLTGRRPRSGPVKPMLRDVGRGEIPPIPVTLDPALSRLIRAALRVEAEARPSAAEMAAGLAGWLDGVERREEALKATYKADRQRPALRALRRDVADLRRRILAMDRGTPEARSARWREEDRAAKLETELAVAEVRWVQVLQGALTRAPDLPEAHSLLADYYRGRLIESEARRDQPAAARMEVFLRGHDRGEHTDFLAGTGTISVRSTHPAQARLLRVHSEERRLIARVERELGQTPLVRVPVERGSWIIELQRLDGPAVRYPVYLDRQEHWDGVPPWDRQAVPVWLPGHGELDEEQCYVPAGWCVVGGDEDAPDGLPRSRVWVHGFLMARYPVTWRAWVAWLQRRLDAGDTERVELGWPWLNDRDEFLRVRDGQISLVEPGRADCPVERVSHGAAVAYASDHGARLPLSLEVEKAARGVDGRHTPWGDQLDPSRSRVVGSKPRPSRAVAPGSFPIDESVYGIRDLAGNGRTWCQNWWSVEGPIADAIAQDVPRTGTHREVRGASPFSALVYQRMAARVGDPPERRSGGTGLRLVWDLPPSAQG
ncbi:MAG: SUMF1/EgtB/PvdO family nonheme iron enzyme [Myxococcota bacterium]